MAIQPVYESVRLNSKKKTAQKQIKIEGKTEIPVEAFNKVLDVSAFIGALDTEITQGKIKFNGRALFNIVYETEDKSLKKLLEYRFSKLPLLALNVLDLYVSIL